MKTLTIFAALLLVGAAGCASSKTEGKGSAAAASSSQTSSATSVSPTPSPSPSSSTPVTMDGDWSGSTSSGEDVEFTVDGHKITKVTMPKMKCGIGMPTTIETEVPFTGRSFQVVPFSVPYTIYPDGGGAPYSAADEAVLKGTFTSSTTAKGTVVVKVVSNGSVTDSCSVTWTASKSELG